MKIFRWFQRKLQRLLYQYGFLHRGNKRKRAGFLFISSNKTLYLTVGLSVILHVGVISIVPAVVVFSEGFGGAPSEMIVVDFIQEAGSENQSSSDQIFDKQFRVPTSQESPLNTDENPSQPSDEPEAEDMFDPGDVDMNIPPPKDDGIKLETPFRLIADASREPEFKDLSRRSVRQQDTPLRREFPERHQIEKPIMKPERPLPVETKPTRTLQARTEIDKKPSIVPIRDENSEDTRMPKENVLFPLRSPQQMDRQSSSAANISESKLEFGRRPVKEMDRKTLVSPSSFDSSSKKRSFGISKEDESDENRFGMFTGKKIELPQMKETVQEPVLQQDKKEITLSEDIEAAKRFKASEQIEGPVKGRKILYQPPPPQINVDIDVEFRLKFWVLPDGTIGEVIPLKRGDAKLERVAIAYLKKWQFEPLSSRVPQQKIWGTIPIKFTIR